MGSVVQNRIASRTFSAESTSSPPPNSSVRGGATSGAAAGPLAAPAVSPAVDNRADGATAVDHHRVRDAPPQDDVVRGFADFRKSAAPARVLCFRGGTWSDFPRPVFEALREGFVAGRSILEVAVGGSPCVFDFVRMSQVDLATSVENSIAWVDVQGRCFFPRWFTDASPEVDIPPRFNRSGQAPPSERPIEGKLAPPASLKEHRSESWEGLMMLDERDKFHKAVANLFLAGMRRFAPGTRVTAVRRCSGGGPSWDSRVRSFQTWAAMTKAARGAANVQYSWYGGAASGIAAALRHGFGQPNHRTLSPPAEAAGVYLSPPQSPHSSAPLSEPDAAGERHVVLCRVIMGKPEKIDVGSPRYHPSGDGYDSGVDDVERPRWYIVWTTRMNTHILPEYVLSFSTQETGTLARRELPGRASPRMGLSLSQLITELGNLLPLSQVQAMERLYNHLKAGKITKAVFIRDLRMIAGDKLLAALMKKIYKRS